MLFREIYCLVVHRFKAVIPVAKLDSRDLRFFAALRNLSALAWALGERVIRSRDGAKLKVDAEETAAAYKKAVEATSKRESSGQSVSTSDSIECSDIFDLNGH
ncbi:hypothetical protein EVAR_84315_1 [Eumeta japonica]|uniref:Uncharacterized protein n=1 Tax=Eumeta variegata TaxID=151549 RepID=A0A4C1U4D4_EUMVA|nr:hypothetical protein EVAR_84315_1 [Eumeta japonica]